MTGGRYVVAVLMMAAGLLVGSHARGQGITLPPPPDGKHMIPWPMVFSADAPGLMNAADLLDKPAGKAGGIVAKDGHFYSGDKRVRFWGVNICFGGCFPTHAEADAVALRLSRFGINAVRFHHMDNQPFPSGIFADAKLETLSPEALDRLDYFIAQLKKNGVYADLNLHVSRSWARTHGMADSGDSYDKMVDIFMPGLIAANRQYARDLLGHVNKYTGNSYAAEPAVGMVEINNEDTLFMWGGEKRLEDLPEPYAGVLGKQWNEWLAKKYGTREKLRAAWAVGATPLGTNLLKDGAFATWGRPGSPWDVEEHENAKRTAQVDNGALRVTVSAPGTAAWHVQFKYAGMSLKKGQFYTVSFTARADKARDVPVSVGQEDDPWANLGLYADAKVTPKDQAYQFGFTATADEPQARITLALGSAAGTTWISRLELREGGMTGLADDEDAVKGTVRRHEVARAVTGARADDWFDFLQQTDEAYFLGMRDFLKKDVGVKAPITGTIGLGALGTCTQAKMDYVDAHAYWEHPQFPHRPWDPKDWQIDNKPMVNDPAGATLWRLAATRVAGKPFTVTEYNHAAPNEWAAECVPMIASFAALQDWDGVFLFAYTHDANYEKDKIDGFFNIEGNPVKMGLMPLGSRIFLGGAITPLAEETTIYLPREKILRTAPAYYDHLFDLLRDEYHITGESTLARRLSITFDGAPPPARPVGVALSRAEWTGGGKIPGQFTVRGPGAVVYVGFPPPDAQLEITPDCHALLGGDPFAVLAAVSARPGEPLAAAKEILLAAVGRTANDGMTWDASRRSVGDQWGRGPAHVEILHFELQQEKRALTPYVLSPAGQRGRQVIDAGSAVSLRVMNSRESTMWWEVAREPAAAPRP